MKKEGRKEKEEHGEKEEKVRRNRGQKPKVKEIIHKVTECFLNPHRNITSLSADADIL